jgi:thymidylate synthase (FAD)
MNIVQPYAKLHTIDGNSPELTSGILALKKIEWCGRISHRSEESQTIDSYDRFIRTVVLGHGDWSIVEHANATVDMLVDRGITHEVVRHRLFSFTQESTRFVNYEKKMPPSFIQPDMPITQLVSWEDSIHKCEKSYQEMIQSGAAPQIARSVFPNALASRIIITGNLRNWRHFFIMRVTKEAHPQMRQVTIPLLKEFQEKIPILYEDIVPLEKQTIAMSKMR